MALSQRATFDERPFVTRLYFAYGSNMSVAQMRRRCPGARPLGIGKLVGWRFAINARGTATVVPRADAQVWGVLWRLTGRHLATLDTFEGLARRRYVRRSLRITCEDGRKVEAVTYVGLHSGRGRAVRAYLEGTILPAAKAFRLPDPYVAELERAAGGRMFGPARPHPRRRGWRP